MFKLGKKNKTFLPQKNISKGTKLYELQQYAEATLGSGDLLAAVKVPEGEDLNEWLAVNTVDFFNQTNMLYGTISDFCTPQECPVMSAGPKYEYMWCDGKKVKQAIKVSAPEYMDYLMNWVQDQLDDEEVFPSELGATFPSNFTKTVRTIFKRLFRVYAHIYHTHFGNVVELGEEAHVNTSFKHFIFFVNEFGLMSKSEMEPMEELIATFVKQKKEEHS
eukprot:CAMPEP_0174260496 /NCGR_PEP_ID=MMETSP0439-20130205/9759_1 /TAXON_ID=0 /ORGANISM="Stereomyxa ramosa, Strain Chinc5" /LENGTH=218 /DNA_ID=CAMNT_0015344747 /DNA_START=32 /DNA_END=688 /DNA_ORIENTATION=+